MPDAALIKQLRTHEKEIIAAHLAGKPGNDEAGTERAEIILGGLVAYLQNRDRREVARMMENIQRHFSRYSPVIATSRLELTGLVVGELNNLEQVLVKVLSRDLGPQHRLLKKLQIRLQSLILLIQLVTINALLR